MCESVCVFLFSQFGRVLPVCIGICPPDTPAKKSWLQIGELWLYTSSSSIDKNLNNTKDTAFRGRRLGRLDFYDHGIEDEIAELGKKRESNRKNNKNQEIDRYLTKILFYGEKGPSLRPFTNTPACS